MAVLYGSRPVRPWLGCTLQRPYAVLGGFGPYKNGRYGHQLSRCTYSVGQHNSTNLLALGPDLLRAHGQWNRDQGA